MDIRKFTRSVLAFLPILALCGVACYSIYSAGQIQDAEIAKTMEKIAFASLGSLATLATGASSYYFKADRDE